MLGAKFCALVISVYSPHAVSVYFPLPKISAMSLLPGDYPPDGGGRLKANPQLNLRRSLPPPTFSFRWRRGGAKRIPESYRYPLIHPTLIFVASTQLRTLSQLGRGASRHIYYHGLPPAISRNLLLVCRKHFKLRSDEVTGLVHLCYELIHGNELRQ